MSTVYNHCALNRSGAWVWRSVVQQGPKREWGNDMPRHEPEAEAARAELAHRLLQGYPMAPLMQPLHEDFALSQDEALETERPLILGVLPRAACNPEVRRTAERWPALRSRRVGGLYFGGGTANLTPPADLRALARTLEETFDLRDSEVTLEGALLDVLSGMGVRHRRLSLPRGGRLPLARMRIDLAAYKNHGVSRRRVRPGAPVPARVS